MIRLCKRFLLLLGKFYLLLLHQSNKLWNALYQNCIERLKWKRKKIVCSDWGDVLECNFSTALTPSVLYIMRKMKEPKSMYVMCVYRLLAGMLPRAIHLIMSSICRSDSNWSEPFKKLYSHRTFGALEK